MAILEGTGDDVAVGDGNGDGAGGRPAPAGGPRRRRRGELRLTVVRTLRLAWQADHRTFVTVILLTMAPAAIPPVMVELSKRLVDLIAASSLQVVDARPTSSRSSSPSDCCPPCSGWSARSQGRRQELFGRRVYLEAERRFLHQAATVDLGHFDNSDWHDRVARAQKDISWRPGQMTWALVGMAGNLDHVARDARDPLLVAPGARAARDGVDPAGRSSSNSG